MCKERLFLLRCLVSIFGVFLLVAVVDFTYCRWYGAPCQVQRMSVRDAVTIATAGISGLLIKLSD